MKIKNYKFEGFGFPVVFDELPAVKVLGELVPDVDFDQYAKPLIEHICAHQDVPLSGNQVKFIRNYFGMSLREFAKMLNVTHQSVMRWESRLRSSASIDVNTELVMRIIIIKRLQSKDSILRSVLERIDRLSFIEDLKDYKKLEEITFSTISLG